MASGDAKKTLRKPASLKDWWSHGPAEAGAGILCQDQFLCKFATAKWSEEVDPGRAGILRLDGPSGSLDIVVLYLKTGNGPEHRKEREDTIGKVSRFLRPQSEALTIVMGDWNFVREHEDRVNLEHWDPEANRQDVREHDRVAEILLDPKGLWEVYQSETTHHSTLCASRIDRVYANPHLSCNYTGEWRSRAMDWCKELSTHRPIEIQYKVHGEDKAGGRTLPMGPARHRDWAPRVVRRWQELESLEEKEGTAFRKLKLLKRAIKEVSLRMDREGEVGEAVSKGDQLSCAIKALKALDSGRWDRLEVALKEFPMLGNKVNLQEACAGKGEERRKLQNLILEIAREEVQEDIEGAKRFRQGQENLKQRHKEGIDRKLAKLKLGSFGSVQALQTEDGTITADREEIAKELGRYWGRVFERKEINQGELEKWLAEVNAEAQEERLPTEARNWKIRRKDVAWAVKCCRNSAPGPDGISATHWKRLGAVAVDLLFSVAQEAARAAAPDGMIEAEEAEAERKGEHTYNKGLMVCIPKKAVMEHEDLGPVFSPETTRPLMIVDIDNRILALSYKKGGSRS